MSPHTGLHEVPATTRIEFVQRDRFLTPAALAAGAYFIAACILTALTKLPFVDEGTFGGSAVNILRTGFSGNPSTPPWGLGIPLEQSTRYNFWVMPAYLYTLAAWFRFAPQSVISGRVLSILFGVVALILFYRFIRLLGGSRAIATLSLVLLATDFNMILRCSLLRMDSMSLLLNLAAWVSYLQLRDRHLSAALFCAASLASLSFVTHPNGIIAFAGILFLVLFFDRSRLKPRLVTSFVAGASIPAVVTALTILRAPAVWAQQVQSHAVHRFAGLEHPLDSIRREFLSRYYWPFGGLGFGSPLDSRFPLERMILLLVLLAYSVATVCMFLPRFRVSRLANVSLSIFLATTVYFTFFETGKLVLYNIHILPFFALFLAIAAVSLLRLRATRLLMIASLAAVFVVNSTSTIFYARTDHYRRSYVRVLAYLRNAMGPHDLLLSHAYFGFDLGFDRVTEDFTLVDIVRRQPRFVTLDHWFKIPPDTKTYIYGPDPVAAGMISQEEKTQAVADLWVRYRMVLTTPDYVLYQRTGP